MLQAMFPQEKPLSKPMTLYVIDDHPLMREAVVMLLRRIRPGAEVVELDRSAASKRPSSSTAPPT